MEGLNLPSAYRTEKQSSTVLSCLENPGLKDSFIFT